MVKSILQKLNCWRFGHDWVTFSTIPVTIRGIDFVQSRRLCIECGKTEFFGKPLTEGEKAHLKLQARLRCARY